MAFLPLVISRLLPADVLSEAMSYLSLADLKACAVVCSVFQGIAQDAIWADPALDAEHLHKVLLKRHLFKRLRHIRVMAAPDVLLDPATTTTLRALLDATKSHLRGLSLLSGILDRNTLNFVAGQDLVIPFHLTALRISLPSWDDIAVLPSFLRLSVLDLNTTRALPGSIKRLHVRMGAVVTFIWRHDGAADAAVRTLAAALVLPAVEEFTIYWSKGEVDEQLTAALVDLQSAFTTSSPRLSTYQVSIDIGNQFTAEDHPLAVIVRHMPSSVNHLQLNCDVGPFSALAQCIPATVDRVTLATTIEGTVWFLKAVLAVEEWGMTSNIRFVTVAPHYHQQGSHWYDVDPRSHRWLCEAPHGAVFSDWTWFSPTIHSDWGKTETSFELHRRMQKELRPLAAALNDRGIRVVDVVGTAADRL